MEHVPCDLRGQRFCCCCFLQPAPTPPLAEQEKKDPHSDFKGNTDCGKLATGSGEWALPPAAVAVARILCSISSGCLFAARTCFPLLPVLLASAAGWCVSISA